jgi:tetratricopeptide (TPR) repeat protein
MDSKLVKALKLAKKKIKEGSFEEAERVYRSILIKFPSNKKAQKGLNALISETTNKFDEVADPPQDRLQKIINLFKQGKVESALDQAYKEIDNFPFSVVLYNICGAAHTVIGQNDEAIRCYKQAITINPNFADANYNMGISLKNRGDLKDAILSFKEAVRIKPDYADAFNNMGNTLIALGDIDGAIESYIRAIEISPNYAEAYNNKGAAFQDKGDLDAAIACYKRAIDINPDYCEAHRNLSHLIDYSIVNEHFIQLKRVYSVNGLTDDQRCNLNFALAKAHEDLGEFGKAFCHFAQGNAIRKRLLGYTIDRDKKVFIQLKRAKTLLNSQALKKVEINIQNVPIFVVGMPRSGTTLVEQIISSHSHVTAAGELNSIDRYGGLLAQGAAAITSEALLQFRKNYLQDLAEVSNGKRLVIDKMPQNFTCIALICAAFPEAKIVHVKRDAAATCWSNYSHFFSQDGLGYSYSLEDVVSYYELYYDLMKFWQSSYSHRIYQLNYESITYKQINETTKLIQHLGLDWEDACLSPEKQKRASSTASQQQVRKAIYQGSSLEWLHYRPFLGEAFDHLSDIYS